MNFIDRQFLAEGKETKTLGSILLNLCRRKWKLYRVELNKILQQFFEYRSNAI